MRLFIFIFLSFVFVHTAQAQELPTEAEARKELEERGITEAEFRARMKQKGYDLDNVQPEQLPELEAVVQETLDELEREKSSMGSGNTGSGDSNPNAVKRKDGKRITENKKNDNVQISDKEIKEAVEDGATLEEAIAEKKSEKTKESQAPATVYGQQVFRNQSLEVYRSADNIKPPDTYVLGSGDELIVAIFGRSQAEFAFTVNEEGFIQPTGGSRIYLRGLTLEKAKRLVQQRFSQYYSFAPEQFALTVNAARTITVNIFGETESYGSFTISAINTAFNALVAAGGPTEIGTVRKIKVIRGAEVKILDVYDFLFDPSVQYDFFLQNNDIIQVPVSEKIVEISGAIKRPFKYELIEGEDLVDLIRYAGGLNVNAYLDNVQVNRIVGGQRAIIDVNLSEIITKNTGFALQNGDEIQVRAVTARLENYAEIEGAVEFEGKYELTPGMRVTDLTERGGLKEEARTDLAFILRQNPDSTTQLINISLDSLQKGSAADIELQSRDRLIVYSQKNFTDSYKIYVAGAVRDAETIPFDLDAKIADLVNRSGGLSPDATGFADITRTNPANDNIVDYIRVDVTAALTDPGSAANVALQPEDKVTFLSSRDFSDRFEIKVEGAVREPGAYQYSATLSLSDALNLAGGLQLNAAANRIDIFRVVLNENEPTQTVVATVQVDRNLNIISGGQITLEPFDIIVVRSVPDFELQKTVNIGGEVKYPGVYALLSDNERVVDVINRAGGLTPEAFPEGAKLYRKADKDGIVIMELDEALKKPTSRFNYIMKEGDTLSIPKSKDLVQVLLPATLANELYPDSYLKEGKINVAFVPGKNAEWYLKKYAGGIARSQDARKRFISVEYPNGEFKRSRGFLFFRGTPDVKKGSIVKVGTKPPKPPKPEKEEKEPIDWNTIVKDFLAIAGGAATIILSILVATRDQSE